MEHKEERAVAIVATPAYLEFSAQTQEAFADWVNRAFNLSSEIDFVVGDPTAHALTLEDQERTARVPFLGNQKVYCKKDFYPDKTLITFFLASEY